MAENRNRSGSETNRNREQEQEGGNRQQGNREGADTTGQYSLDEREYQGRDGETHHHTNTYMEQHGRSGKGGSGGESENR